MTERNVLLIAFHAPPLRGISGIQRTSCFARYLPQFGWTPIVLSVRPAAYVRVAAMDPRCPDLPYTVHRVLAFDAQQHFSLFGRYPRWLSLPDRWASWQYFAVPKAMEIIRRRSIAAIWSTFPIATAHKIGLAVAKRSGIPWIAEFRDPMWQGAYPPDPVVNRTWRTLEERVFHHAAHVVVTAPSAARQYAERYPTFDPSRISVIENGYDEEVFSRLEATARLEPSHTRRDRDRLLVLHSGVIYPSERDPTQLFAALASIKTHHPDIARRVHIVLRNTGHDELLNGMIHAHGIRDLVDLAPPLGYSQALEEMMNADGLMLLQASNCNAQIPAKLYEYLRTRRPIIALTDPEGDTAATLRRAGSDLIARLDSQVEIEELLVKFIAQNDAGVTARANTDFLTSFSRKQQAAQLAQLMESII